MAKQKQVYQIKITLRGSKPPIWRRVMVPSDITLDRLSNIILRAMGWYGGHMHQFDIDGIYYGRDESDLGLGGLEPDMEDESKVRLDSFIHGEGRKFAYEYDFGDDWQHLIVVERIFPYIEGQVLPVCIKGKRACPPEDVGGVWGYEDFIEIMNDPDHEEHEQMAEWYDEMYGGEFDPEAFDLDEINDRLKNIRL